MSSAHVATTHAHPTPPAWRTPEPAPMPTGEPAPSFWARPAVVGALRAASVVAGLGLSAAAFVFVGLWMLLLGCVGNETTGICAGNAALVPFLEWPIFVTAVAAPLAGGIATCATRQPRWIAGGVALAFAMLGLTALVSQTQTGLLS